MSKATPSLIILIALSLATVLLSAPVEVAIDTAAQVNETQTFEHVARMTAQIPYARAPKDAPDNWAYDRYEGIMREYLSWFNMSSNTSKEQLWRLDEEGNYHFVPDPKTEERLRETLRSGMRPFVQFATSTMPPDLAQGGNKPGFYGYNVRQPADYEKWAFYVGTIFDYLIETFGVEQVRSWSYRFGIESDWQTKAIYPDTGELMNREDNRREFMKILDTFHGVATEKLGPNVYVGNYASFETQLPDYLKHWAEGTNYYTGETGTRIAFTGYSDWSLLNFVDDISPFTLEGKAFRRKHPDAWAAMASIATGLVWKHDYIDERADQYPSLRGLETNLPEQGYFDTKGSTNNKGEKKPVDYMPADHRGTALYAMRAIAYTHAPRVAWSNTRFALGTGDSSGDYRDDVKTPVFHALRIEKELDGQRLLPTEYDSKGKDGNEVRVAATAVDGPVQQFHVLAVNFNNDFEATTSERVVLTLDNLPKGTTELLVDGTRIDSENNNWWAEWTAYRKENGIDYVRGQSATHLGRNFLWDPQYIENTNHIRGTTDKAGYRVWLDLLPQYREMDDLETTFSEQRVKVSGNNATLEYDIPANGTLLLTVTALGSDQPRHVFGEIPLQEGWEKEGVVEWVTDDTDASFDAGVRLIPNESGVSYTRRFDRLEPNTAYAVVIEAKSELRMLDYGMELTGEGDPVVAWGDYTGFWNRLVATTKTTSGGELEIKLQVPQQPVSLGDGVHFRNLTLRRL